MRFVDIINKKREKLELTNEEIQFWIDGIVDGVKKLYCDYELRSRIEDTTSKRDYGNSYELNKLYKLF